MNINEEQIETLDSLDSNNSDVNGVDSQVVLPADNIVKPQPINVEDLANSVSPTDLQSTNISNFGQEGIPLDNINQNPKPSSLETVPKSEEYNNIGMVPPNAHVEQVPKKNNKKLLFIIIAIVLVLAVGIFIYLYLNQGNKVEVKLTLKEVNIQVGERISTKIEDYIENSNEDISNCMLNTDSILNNKIGNYKYKIICGNRTYTGDLKVVDNIAPIVNTKYVTRKLNEQVNIEDFIVNCEDASSCHYSYLDENKVVEALKQSGTYEIIINVSDDYDNKLDVTSYLIVLANDITHNLVCNSKDILSEDSKYNYKITDTLGLYSDQGFVFGNVASREYMLTFLDKSNYDEAKGLIQENGNIELGTIVGKATYDDENMIIKVSRLLMLADLNKEFSNFPKAYADIRKLYQNDGRGFSCSASKVN